MIVDFFICDADELATRFTGWVRPGPDWMPSFDEPYDPDPPDPLDGLQVLQGRAFGDPTLDLLIEALLPEQRPPPSMLAEPPLLAPSGEQFVATVPAAVVKALAVGTEDSLTAVLETFLQALRADIESIGDPGTRNMMLETCTAEQWMPPLAALAAFARQAHAARLPLHRFQSL